MCFFNFFLFWDFFINVVNVYLVVDKRLVLFFSGLLLGDLWLFWGDLWIVEKGVMVECLWFFINFILVYGCLMVIGWGIFVVWGVYIVRYFKLLGDIWFYFYLIL